jgi:hypothetical protein
MKKLLSSLVFLSLLSLGTGCYATTPRAPDTVEVSTQLDRAQVRAKLAERRAVMLDRFVAYREGRVYPIIGGTGTKRPSHTWFDDAGNLCAAATLISGDWGRDSTMKVGKEQRHLVLAKVTKGELADWMLTSGLAHHELVAIQVPPMDTGGVMPAAPEVERLYTMYVDVERQLRALSDDNLDLATDRLMQRPELARALLAAQLPGPGKYTIRAGELPPSPAPEPNPEPPPAPPAAD